MQPSTRQRIILLVPILLAILAAGGYMIGKMFFEKPSQVTRPVLIPRYCQVNVQGTDILVPVPNGVAKLEHINTEMPTKRAGISFSVGKAAPPEVHAPDQYSFTETYTDHMTPLPGENPFETWKRTRDQYRREAEASADELQGDFETEDGRIVIATQLETVQDENDFVTMASHWEKDPKFTIASSIFLVKNRLVTLSILQWSTPSENGDALTILQRWRADLLEANKEKTPTAH